MDLTSEREAAIFSAARRLPANERALYLDAACAGDALFRRQIEELLEADDSAGAFLAELAAGAGGTVRVGAGLDPAATVEASASHSERPGDTIDRYKLMEQIGEGGFGVVYVAEQKEPVKRRVALKIIKLGMDTKAVVARFAAERQALALMDHPNIAKVLDAGTTSTGRPFFVMELVKGIKLTDYCNQHRLSTQSRLDLFTQVCRATQHAHQKGIIHRDIKPSNILVTLHDGVPVPKVIDFGIAKATQGDLTDQTVYTQYQQFIGTPAYMSPEQAEMSGLDIDTRSDIYSLGVLLYELLTGKTPFDSRELLASGLDAMRRTIREKEPARPSTRLATLGAEELTTAASQRSSDRSKLLHQLKGDLDWIVMKALEKDRTRRYETANALAADVGRHLGNEPVVARPPSAGYRFQKAFRRNKLAFASGMAVAAALVVGVAVSTWLAFVARKAQREAEVAQKGEERQRLQAQSALKVSETEHQRAEAQALKATESQQRSRRLLYAAEINLAQQALNANDLGKARRLLERQKPQPGEEDLRGWEWRYLWQLTRAGSAVTLTNRQGASVSFSPDGKVLAAGRDDGRVDLWDVPGRRWIRTLTEGKSDDWGRAAFSPVRNVLATTYNPKVVAFYDLDSGREPILWRAPDHEAWRVKDLSFSQDGSRLAIYAGGTAELGDAVWVVNMSSSTVESRHTNVFSGSPFFGSARISPDNQRLYMTQCDRANHRYSIRCLDLSTGAELWQTPAHKDFIWTAMALSPDGRMLASGSGYGDTTIRLWDAATGSALRQLDGHTGWVSDLAFSKDGRRLLSASSDATLRLWNTNNWSQPQVLRGIGELHATAISDSAQLVAGLSKEGDLTLWKADGNSAADGYRRLDDSHWGDEVWPLDQSRLLLLPTGKPPQWVNLKTDSPPELLPGIGFSTNVLGWFGSNILCRWDGTNQVLVHELRGSEFIQRGAIVVDSGPPPRAVDYQTARRFASGYADVGAFPLTLDYNPGRQLLAWVAGASSNSVHVASLGITTRRVELRGDIPGLTYVRFSEAGNYLAASTPDRRSLQVWDVETGRIVASHHGRIADVAFAAGGKVLAVNTGERTDLYDLAHPGQAPRPLLAKYSAHALAVSPDAGLVVSADFVGFIRLLDPVKGGEIDCFRANLNAVLSMAFSGDGHRLITACGAREAVKLWDVGTWQELLTLGGEGSPLFAVRWSADGNVILAGRPWQAWRAPSMDEIEAAEAKERAGP